MIVCVKKKKFKKFEKKTNIYLLFSRWDYKNLFRKKKIRNVIRNDLSILLYI